MRRTGRDGVRHLLSSHSPFPPAWAAWRVVLFLLLPHFYIALGLMSYSIRRLGVVVIPCLFFLFRIAIGRASHLLIGERGDDDGACFIPFPRDCYRFFSIIDIRMSTQ